jgi:hypothetical protein
MWIRPIPEQRFSVVAVRKRNSSSIFFFFLLLLEGLSPLE